MAETQKSLYDCKMLCILMARFDDFTNVPQIQGFKQNSFSKFSICCRREGAIANNITRLFDAYVAFQFISKSPTKIVSEIFIAKAIGISTTYEKVIHLALND